jgi:hypothetical protein
LLLRSRRAGINLALKMGRRTFATISAHSRRLKSGASVRYPGDNSRSTAGDHGGREFSVHLTE